MVVHANRNIQGTSFWSLLIEPTPGRLAYATRLSLICALVAIVAEVYKTPEIALTVYVAFFLNKRDRASSMLLTIAFTVIITVVIGVLFVLAGPVLKDPSIRVCTMASISFVMIFLTSASKLKPLSSTIALVIAYALDVLGSVPQGELATRALLYAWLFVGIPALVSAVINLLIAPSPRDIVQQTIAERLRTTAALLERVSGSTGNQLTGLISMGDTEIQAHLKLTGMEKTSSAEDIAALKGASDSLVTVLSAVQIMLDDPQARPPGHIRKIIVSRLLEVSVIFAAGGYPANVEPVTIDGPCADLAVSAIAFLNTGFVQFGKLRPDVISETSKKPSGFFVPDAFTNPIHLQFALKVTLAAMFCYLLYSILSWPGIHTALITCFIVSLGTAAESVEKLTLRICGCLAGAGLGLLVMLRVIPLATGIGSLVVIVFAGTFLGAWVAAGSKHISYAGFQIAFAYLLCVIQGPSPKFDMTVARDRVIGILIGNVVSYLVATRIWPVSVGPRIENCLKSVNTKLAEAAGTRDAWSRQRIAAETNSMLDEVTSDIHLTAYEPAWIRPKHKWLSAQKHAVEAAEQLEPVLLGIGELKPEFVGSNLRSLLSGSAAVGTWITHSISAETTSHASLVTLLRNRVTAFQQAMLNIEQEAQDE